MTEFNNPDSIYPVELHTAPLNHSARRLALAWLIVIGSALVISGLFAVLLLIARLPKLEILFTIPNFINTTPIIYFNQTTIIWFLASCGLLWSLYESQITFGHRVALVFTTLGSITLGLTPLIGFSEPILNYYLPILRHPLFWGGIFIFSLGIFLQVLLTLRQINLRIFLNHPAQIAAITIALTVFAAFLTLIWTGFHLTGWEGQTYFEFLFWGSGHIMQFAYTQLMITAWLGIATGLKITLRISEVVLKWLIIIGILPLLFIPVHYLRYAVASPELHHAFVMLMRHGGGIAAIPIGLIIFYELIQQRGELSNYQRPLLAALSASLILFIIGGLLGGMITMISSLVPVHYHAFTAGVRVALMGLIYHLLPILGFMPPASRLAAIQPWLYAGGELLHIIGFTIAANLGIQSQNLLIAPVANEISAKIVVGIMEFGDLLAAIGIIVFIVVIINSLNRNYALRW